MKQFLLLTLMLTLAGCASSPGSNPATADFNKYGENYDAFPVNSLRTGMTTDELSKLFPTVIRTGAGPNGETFKVERWASVVGPDYVEERLHMTIKNGRLTAWHIEKINEIEIVTRR